MYTPALPEDWEIKFLDAVYYISIYYFCVCLADRNKIANMSENVLHAIIVQLKLTTKYQQPVILTAKKSVVAE